MILPFSVANGVTFGEGMVIWTDGQVWERNDVNVYEGCNVLLPQRFPSGKRLTQLATVVRG